jgi:16S rRNA (uracil1498-N3)-methyltransferase
MPDWHAVEEVVEHAVPLGVARIDLVSCERSRRSGIGPQRVARLERIARAGLKQSRRSRLPRLDASPSVDAALKALTPGERFRADPEGESFPRDIQEDPQRSIQLAVGPPGGFSDRERALLESAEFRPIYLGPSRLTTQTAALALTGLARNSL